MRYLWALALLLVSGHGLLLAEEPEIALTPAQTQFRSELVGKVAALDKTGSGAIAGRDGWLFLTSELRFLAQGRFWGEAAARLSQSRKAQSADPIPAIVDFHRQLKERGIELLLVPVPPKAAIYPDKVGVDGAVAPGFPAAPYLARFYDELRSHGVDVLDLTAAFAKQRDQARGPVDCLTDSHWSGVGCVLAAQAIAERVRDKIPPTQARRGYSADWKEVAIKGDLVGLLSAGTPPVAAEKISIRAISEKGSGAGVQPDANSPVLVLGDSHTLVFHEFLAERAGLLDQLAHELSLAPDLIGTRGSGATAVRVSLYRRVKSDPGYFAKKKVIVWCFAAREFTETDQGWVVQPIAK